MGTSTQLGKAVQVTLYIYDYSTEDDKQILIEASAKGKNQGLVSALVAGILSAAVRLLINTVSPMTTQLFWQVCYAKA